MAGPPTVQRYNAKARGSVAGGSHKKRKRSAKGDGEAEEPKSSIIGGVDTRGMSSKKKKRLESYIDKKLKSEARLETLKRLQALALPAEELATIRSTASLGQRPDAPTSAKDRQEWQEDRLVRQGIQKLRKRHGGEVEDVVDSGEESEDSPVKRGQSAAENVSMSQPGPSRLPAGPSEPSGQSKKTKAKKSKQAHWNPNLLPTQPVSDSSDFDSYDSANDSSDEEEEDQVPEEAESEPRAEPAASLGEELKPPLAPEQSKPTSSAPTGPTVFGGALKRNADGSAITPRVVVRRKKALIREQSPSLSGSEDEEDDDMDEEGDDMDDEEDNDESEGSHDDSPDESGEDGDSDDDDDDEDDEDEASAGDDEADAAPASGRKRSLGFKAWAMAQLGQAKPLSTAPDLLQKSAAVAAQRPAGVAASKPSGPMNGPLGARLSLPESAQFYLSGKASSSAAPTSSKRPTITRKPEIDEARMALPILAEEQIIVETVRLNPIVCIRAETGSGKTTQVPQMLYEAGFGFKDGDDPGIIAVTQPRRVAAVALATRVGEEMNLPPKSKVVAHQVRYSSTRSPDTAISFMTDGILLRELANDLTLSKYSVIIIDEAHERGVNTDVLMGFLIRIATQRWSAARRYAEAKNGADTNGKTVDSSSEPPVKPLRIVIMSATLDISTFDPQLFRDGIPPTIDVPGRQFNVTTHFSRRTKGTYIEEAKMKVAKIHARLPPGGILVFMTGRREIDTLCKQLKEEYGLDAIRSKPTLAGRGPRGKTQSQPTKPDVEEANPTPVMMQDGVVEAEDVELGPDEDLAADVDDGIGVEDPDALDTDEDEDMAKLGIKEDASTPMHVLPLYSLMATDKQMQVFQPPPEGHRLVVVATNVAETSLTIPGITYVVDSGRAKERTFDRVSSVQSFKVGWISKASAQQRQGRAGRTGPGHCYRLYSSAVYEEHFLDNSPPEILRTPIDTVVLQLKAMHIDNVAQFPFPTPPDRAQLTKAERLLVQFGALAVAPPPSTSKSNVGASQLGSRGGSITHLGMVMAKYPVPPRFAKMLSMRAKDDPLLPYIIAVVACLSVGEASLDEEKATGEADSPAEKSARKKAYWIAQARFAKAGGKGSDVLKTVAAAGAYSWTPEDQRPKFCWDNFLRYKAMNEIYQLRQQLCKIAEVPFEPLKPFPAEDANKSRIAIRKTLLAGFIDQIAFRADIAKRRGNAPGESTRPGQDIAYWTNLSVNGDATTAEKVYIHRSSSLHGEAPPYITFADITQSQGHGEAMGKIFVQGVTEIKPEWIVKFARGLVTLSKLTELPGTKAAALMAKQGGQDGAERIVVVTPHYKPLGVDLPPVKWRQRKVNGTWVPLEHGLVTSKA